MYGIREGQRKWPRQAWRAALFAVLGLVVAGASALAQDAVPAARNSTIPEEAPELLNPSFECAYGEGYRAVVNSLGDTVYLPAEWKLAYEVGGAVIHSARIFFEQRADPTGGCDTDHAHVERAFGGGDDSLVVRARDLETPPQPGKPFDVILSQQVAAVPGAGYSLSGWALSLCGGSKVPSDCPEGVYITKAIGIDPTGGADPLAPQVVWAENNDNFVNADQERIGWTNLRMAARAQDTQITVFVRLNSPFQHHGNHGFIDALSLVRGPGAYFDPLPTVVRSGSLAVSWTGEQSPDVEAIDGGTYELLFDVQVRLRGEEDWQALQPSKPGKTCAVFTAPGQGVYEFRIRARAEQPPAPPEGAAPNHRYPGIWSDIWPVRFVGTAQPAAPAAPVQILLPAIQLAPDC